MYMKHLIRDHEDAAKDEFVVTVRLRVVNEAALLASAYAKVRTIGRKALLSHGCESSVGERIAKSRTEISLALAEVLLGHFDDPKSGLEMIATEINQWPLREFTDRKDGAAREHQGQHRDHEVLRSNPRY
jgi:hypothetical protein